MSSSSGQKDPSMDEILGSIRRIITEDAQSGRPDGAAPGAEADDVLDLTEEVGAENSRVEPSLSPVEPAAGVAGEASERREPVFDTQPPAEDAAAPDAPLAADSTAGGETPPVFETTHVDEISAAEPAPVAEPPAVASASMFGAQTQEQPAMADTEAPATPSGDEIVSQSATVSAAAALGELSQALDQQASRLRLGEGDATVSDIVKELLRPMLAEWLDKNLPGIVERVVQREIQKLVDRSPGAD